MYGMRNRCPQFSIRSRSRYIIDHDDIARSFCRFQSQANLFLERRENRRTVRFWHGCACRIGCRRPR
jgi:hypothetical protein